MNGNTEFWKDLELQPDELIRRDLGPLHLWVQLKNNEIWLAHYTEHENETFDPGGFDIEALEWSRWALNRAPQRLKFRPLFPDRPVMVNSEYPLQLNTGSKIQIFTRLQLWVRVSVDQPKDYVLSEIPTYNHSQTWFGTPLEGELCYWSSTKARRSLPKEIYRPHYINCPIWIINKSDSPLNFEKFCYRVERLSIYQFDDEFWADETNITYFGEELNSEIHMTGKLPEMVKKSELISTPRKRIQKSIATRTFKRLFDETLFLAR